MQWGKRYAMNEEMILLFPAVLKEKIRTGEFVFPNETEYKFDLIEAYRCYFRNNDNRTIDREDFRSHAEKGIRLRGTGNRKPEYYGTSLFVSLDELENIESLNKPGKCIAKGLIYDKGGPICKSQKNTHICWWMYEKADVSSFKKI